MAPRGASTWRRPYTSIYNDNYRYGTGLYSDTLSDIEKRYSESLSKTQLRSDRPDLAFTTFSGSNLTSSPAPGGDSSGNTREARGFTRQTSVPSSLKDIIRDSTFESKLSTTLNSSYALDEEVQDVINSRIEQRKQKMLARSAEESNRNKLSRNTEETTRSKDLCLYDDASFWTLPKPTAPLSNEGDLDTTRSKRKIGGRLSPTNGPTSSRWREKSRELQDQVDALEQSMSDSSNKLRSELSSLKSRYHTEIADLNRSVEQTSEQASDLQKICKKQASQLTELQSAYDIAQRNVEDALQEMDLWQNKCKSLKKEMERLRGEVEQAIHKSSSASNL
ncbi:myosin-2-like [Stegodyphus dumicola]|uniref:myosin-2-like n=1 Tax=Stegodyphus dumicola TaxID=202533 RepID=UPI0015B12DCE|nr:myosin-2-like [Stegodyphus dumicola]